MNKIKEKMSTAVVRFQARCFTGKKRLKEKLQENGGNFFTEHGLAIVIVVVIAAILLTAIVALFKGKILPQLDNKVDELFSIS